MTGEKDFERHPFVDMLGQLLRGADNHSKLCSLFAIFVGRKPSESEYGHYLDQLGKSDVALRRIILEIALCEESKRVGLVNAVMTDMDGLRQVSELHVFVAILASMGFMLRGISEQTKRLADLETLSKLTLLSVPEWCGQAHDRLEERLERIEKLVGNAVN